MKDFSKLNADEYVRLFEFRNYPLFYDSLWLQYYKDKETICINAKGIRTAFMSKRFFLKSLEEGKTFFADPNRILEYIEEFNKVERDLLQISGRLINDFSLLVEFKAIVKDWFDYYSYTDFQCTDLAQKEIENNFPNFGKFKDKKRETINKVAVGENSYLVEFLKNYAKKKEIRFEDLLLYTIDELIQGEKIDVFERKDHLIYYEGAELRIITGKKALEIETKFRNSKLSEGIIANKGIVRGNAFVFHNDISNTSQLPKIINEMRNGDIFITETTSPELVLFCKKAGAIITNQGGIMSHAATISRELNIPCIVGVNNATHYFKTGDLIEVDANKGVVKILKRAD